MYVCLSLFMYVCICVFVIVLLLYVVLYVCTSLCHSFVMSFFSVCIQLGRYFLRSLFSYVDRSFFMYVVL